MGGQSCVGVSSASQWENQWKNNTALSIGSRQRRLYAAHSLQFAAHSLHCTHFALGTGLSADAREWPLQTVCSALAK